MSPQHQALAEELRRVLPERRIITDPLRRRAYGTDASFYRLVPQIVCVVEEEHEVAEVLRLCRNHRTPATFRAAGTSLSGQAVSDSVLILLGNRWRDSRVSEDGATITLQPALTGAQANRRLQPFGRKIGPDPASINAAMIGGIAANNASGMCCGTANNSYQTLQSLRVILADGSLLDTSDPTSRAAFAETHRDLLEEITALRRTVLSDEALSARIRRKFAIKNTMGYSLNALLDYDDPIDILQHLMIGSEGTLGFISEITLRTVPEPAHKACALVFFENARRAAAAVPALKQTSVTAVELIDRAGLRAAAGKPGMPDDAEVLPNQATALLIDVRGESPEALAAATAKVLEVLSASTPLLPARFTTDPTRYAQLWNIRKGLFPMVGARRQTGTTVIIEDVAFPLEHLAAGTEGLQALFAEHGYHDALIFGHALEGNLHFVFSQGFASEAEIDRYGRFMNAVSELVAGKFGGSLKAEHGTGRNMAPYVEMEWGREAYALMRRIKAAFDPEGLLNPGVILNDDPNAHLKHLKPLASADPLLDKCIECGFCEPTCPSKGLTLSPRQRIAGWRAIREQATTEAECGALLDLYSYQGVETCAGCSLCASACPVEIDTGAFIRNRRAEENSAAARTLADRAARHYGAALKGARAGFRLADLAADALGDERLQKLSEKLRDLSGQRLPLWSPAYPSAYRFKAPEQDNRQQREGRPKVVYFPSCASRTMGPARGDSEQTPLPEKTVALFEKAGYDVIFPGRLEGLCCGQPFASKGFAEQADDKAAELLRQLRVASENGRHPVVFDTSPCALRGKQRSETGLQVFDIVEFLHDHILPRLKITPTDRPIALHPTCSTRKLGLADKLEALARACSTRVSVPADVTCCGWAGDKGFTTPELNAHALRHLPDGLSGQEQDGYATSRTCEIGLSHHTGLPYRSIVYLLDERAE